MPDHPALVLGVEYREPKWASFGYAQFLSANTCLKGALLGPLCSASSTKPRNLRDHPFGMRECKTLRKWHPSGHPFRMPKCSALECPLEHLVLGA